jgi:hypothetical protein
MSQEDPNRPNEEYEGWAVEGLRDENFEYIGQVDGGSPMLFDSSTNTIYEAEADVENEHLIPRPNTEQELEPEETLSKAIEMIGEKTGWESLSEFANDHLNDDDS